MYLDLMHRISGCKKPKNVGKFPLLSVDTFAGHNISTLATSPDFKVDKIDWKEFQKQEEGAPERKFWRRKRMKL